MTKEIYLIRHGESAANAGERTDNPSEIILSEKGQKQALAVARWFSVIPDIIIWSSYIRTLQTALPTMRRFQTSKLLQRGLHEFTYLDTRKYAGTTVLERWSSVEAYLQRLDPNYVDGDGAESFSDMMDRVRSNMAEIVWISGKNFGVFCHRQIMQMVNLIIAYPNASPAKLMQKMADIRGQWIPNCAVQRTMVWDAGLWTPPETIFVPREEDLQ